MLFEPHLGRLAPRHQPEHPPAPAVAPRPTVSVYAALVEAFRLFHERPLAAIGLGGASVLAGLATALPGLILASLSTTSGTSGSATVSIAGLTVPDWLLGIGGAAAAFAALGTPLIVGVYAAAILSARQGVPTCRGLLTGFRLYPASFALGSMAGVITATLGLLPIAGPLISLFTGTLVWAVLSALADRRRGIADALNAGLALIGGRLLQLVLLNLVAGIIGMAGALAACVGVVITIPAMVLMLGVGYRDAAEAAGLTDTEEEAA